MAADTPAPKKKVAKKKAAAKKAAKKSLKKKVAKKKVVAKKAVTAATSTTPVAGKPVISEHERLELIGKGAYLISQKRHPHEGCMEGFDFELVERAVAALRAMVDYAEWLRRPPRIITRFPVYRTYITDDRVGPEDRRDLDWAISRARRETALGDRTVFDFLHAALSTDLVGTRGYERSDVVATAMHFQQLTGPAMAKGLEDTAFYRYARLLALNEVGGDPSRFGETRKELHAWLDASGSEGRSLPRGTGRIADVAVGGEPRRRSVDR